MGHCFKNDVSQDDKSKFVFQTIGIHFCDCSRTSFFLIGPEYILSDKAGEKSTCVAKLKTMNLGVFLYFMIIIFIW